MRCPPFCSLNRCASLLADASSSVQDPAPSALPSGGTRTHAAAHSGVSDTASFIDPTRDRNAPTSNKKRIVEPCSDISSMPLTAALGILDNAASRLRALGAHPALPAVLRRMAKEWVRKWAASVTLAGALAAAAPTGCSSIGVSSEKEAAGAKGRSADDLRAGGRALDVNGLAYLGNAAKCLAEARNVLSMIVASSEPAGDALASVPATSKDNDQTPAETVVDNELSTKPSGKKGKAAAEAAQPPADGGGGKGGKKGSFSGEAGVISAGSTSTGGVDSSLNHSAAISTPLGRVLVMVQLEEACVRAMMGRFGEEARSETEAARAAAHEEGVTPVQR